MVASSGEQDFAGGYDAGRAVCLASGHEAASIHRELRAHAQTFAYWEGWSWALWDYEDANGLPHSSVGA